MTSDSQQQSTSQSPMSSLPQTSLLDLVASAAANLAPVATTTANQAVHSPPPLLRHVSTDSSSSVTSSSSSARSDDTETDEDEGMKEDEHSVASDTSSNKRGGSKKYISFPVVLMNALLDPTNSDIISFRPDNHSFVIHNLKSLVTDVLPRVFHLKRLDTFLKKLARWGFKSLFGGNEGVYTFYHPDGMFVAGNLELCRKIRRQMVPPSVGHAQHVQQYRRQQQQQQQGPPRSWSSDNSSPLCPPQEEQASSSSSLTQGPPLGKPQLLVHAPIPRLPRLGRSPLVGRSPLGRSRPLGAAGAAATISDTDLTLATRTIMGAALKALVRDGQCSGGGSSTQQQRQATRHYSAQSLKTSVSRQRLQASGMSLGSVRSMLAC